PAPPGPTGAAGIFVVRRNLRPLAHLRDKHSFKAENGRDGGGSGRYGRQGEDVRIPLPPGTLLKDPETGALIRDFGKQEKDFVFLKGGNGGWGNIHFKSSVQQAPLKALPGKEGERRALRVELQLLADIGFVGFPNAGKSSLLNRFTNARPKIAPYPFTTKIPNLGVLTLDDRDIILADIPGILEGASQGVGLGIRFLKHISRTAALAFLIDLAEDTYQEAFPIVYKELAAFSPELIQKPRVLVGTKLDIPGAEDRLVQLKKAYSSEKVVGISVFSGAGIPELAACMGSLVCIPEVHEEVQAL
ncbi:MAG: GTPase ObgE, partial [Treponema sp.]|nr:GTPase ObgE [Treponema sp.]